MLLPVLCTAAIFLIIASFLAILPAKRANHLMAAFSLGKKGIKKPRRKNLYTVDLYGNFYLFLGVLFCLVFIFFPFYQVFYGILLGIGYLGLMAQLCRISIVYARWKRAYLIFLFTGVVFVGYCAALGWLNGNALSMYVKVFAQDIFDAKLGHVLYWLQNIAPMACLLQVVLFSIPLYVVGSQFKYMRLENTYKGWNLVTVTIKMVMVIGVLWILGTQGFDTLAWVYQLNTQIA